MLDIYGVFDDHCTKKLWSEMPNKPAIKWNFKIAGSNQPSVRELLNLDKNLDQN